MTSFVGCGNLLTDSHRLEDAFLQRVIPPAFGPFKSFRFELYEYDPSTGQLRKQGLRVRLSNQPLQVLGVLLERAGELVTREELHARIWGGATSIDAEHNLNVAVNKLREALGDSAEEPRFIATVPRRGYRFIAPLNDAGIDAPETPSLTAAARGRGRHRLALVVTVLVLLAAAAGYAAFRQFRKPSPVGRIVLAVLPFENLSGDPEQEYFSEGLTEEVITYLGRLQPSRLGVIARTSVMRFKGGGQSLDRARRELGAQYVLQGSVRRSGARVRVTVQLIQLQDQTNIWAGTYDRELRDLLAVESDVARSRRRDSVQA